MTTRRQFIGTLPTAGAAFAIGGSFLSDAGTARAQATPEPLAGHFHPKGKAPSPHTLAILEQAKEGCPSPTPATSTSRRGASSRR